MPGNRNRQRAFETLILLEMANKRGSINAQRSSDIPPLQRRIFSCFKFSGEDREQKLRDGRPALPHDVLFAADELERKGQITRTPYISWQMTSQGDETLRTFLAALLFAESKSAAVGTIAFSTTEGGEQTLLRALKGISSQKRLKDCILRSSSLRDQLGRAVYELKREAIFDFIQSNYRLIRPLAVARVAIGNGLVANIARAN